MIDYKSSGVNIQEGYRTVDKIKEHARRTLTPDVLSVIGSFGAFMRIPQGYTSPVLVSGTDGVGTKLKVAFALKKYDTVGIDAVAMCVNDILCHGAKPLFFLDYLACGTLDADVAADIVKGITDGCLQGGLALVGGETAEMPGFYEAGEYDIAGFCVGVVEKSEIIDASKVKVGDSLIALASSGPHSNGYSLIRKVLEVSGSDAATVLLDGKPLAEHLLAPTKIYVKSILQLIKHVDVHAISHLTGGGFWENIPRVLPAHVKAVIHENSWQWPTVFDWLQQQGNIDRYEMYRTFNCGVGMVIALPEKDVETALALLRQAGEQAWVIGQIEALGSGEQQVVMPTI